MPASELGPFALTMVRKASPSDWRTEDKNRRACERAGIDRWHVHQLRHSASLKFSREMGLECARAALGHSSVDMSAMYAGHDLEAAKKVAEKVG